MLELEQIESFYPDFLRPHKRNLLREYLQYKILETVFASEFAVNLSFMGGTAIHIAHGLPRFSEDLDFDNRGLKKEDFRHLAMQVSKKLEREGYKIELKISPGPASRISFKILDILYKSNLSNHRGEKMVINLDAEPQEYSYKTDRIIINKFDVFTRINVVPATTLLSQKIYAIFTRKRPMGRDFYDVLYLSGKVKPDFNYLKLKLDIGDFKVLKRKLLKFCKSLNFKKLAKDVSPFLFIPKDADKILLFPEYIRNPGNP